MKLIKSIFLLIVYILNVSNAQQNVSEVPKSAWVFSGQKIPGMTPEIFAPGIISTGMDEACATFSSDGKECFFMININGHETIAVTKKINGNWATPEVAPFSGKFIDGFPCIQPNSSRLFFHSNRPIENGAKYNIWFVEKTDSGWSEPNPVGTPINGENPTLCPSVSQSGTIYFSRQFTNGEELIFRSEYRNGYYTEPEKLPKTINSRKYQFHASISPDESFLILPLDEREDAIGSGENFYVSFRNAENGWSDLINLGKEINSMKIFGLSSFSPDGKYFLFSAYPSIRSLYIKVYNKVMSYHELQEISIKNPTNNKADIFVIDTKIIEKLKPLGLK